MLSPVVQTVLQMGFEASLVESLVQTKYLLTGQHYTCVSDLVTDVLQAEDEDRQRAPQSRGRSVSDLSRPSMNLRIGAPSSCCVLSVRARDEAGLQCWKCENTDNQQRKRSEVTIHSFCRNRTFEHGTEFILYLMSRRGTSHPHKCCLKQSPSCSASLETSVVLFMKGTFVFSVVSA